jgi:hypothetical protein
MFVPIGDPILTNACKELSREKGAMIFIVSVCHLGKFAPSSLMLVSRPKKKKIQRYPNIYIEQDTIFEKLLSTKPGKLLEKL